MAVRRPRSSRDGVVDTLQHRGRALGPPRARPEAGRSRSESARRRGPTGHPAGQDATGGRRLPAGHVDLDHARQPVGAAVRGDDPVPDPLYAGIRYTLESGEVASKRASLLWAMDNLDARWQGLIGGTLEDRSLGWNHQDRPRPGALEATLAFNDYARAQALRSG